MSLDLPQRENKLAVFSQVLISIEVRVELFEPPVKFGCLGQRDTYFGFPLPFKLRSILNNSIKKNVEKEFHDEG